MKHLLATLLLVGSFALVGCGGGGSSPGDAVKEMTYAMEAGDAEKVKELIPELGENLGDGKIDTMVKQAAKETEESGGIESIVIDKEEINGDTAKVTATMTSGNGDVETDDFDLKKVDGKWVVTMGEDMKNAAGGGNINLGDGGDEDVEFPEGFEVPAE